MSGSTIGGVVGAVVGFWVGGPAGAQYGWMIGSAVGGYVDPTQVFGPRLQDTRGQTSAVGGAIPRAWGTAPVPGNIIWQQPGVTEHKHTDDGKGSGTEQVTYTYTRSYAIMFHLGEIAGVLQIKRNGKIVYDARDEATLLAEYEEAMGPVSDVSDWTNRIKIQAAMNNRFMSRCVIYNGTQTQEPDPTIEAYEGVGNAPAYRGRAYMVVTDDETQAGEIAQYEVIVAVCGSTSTSDPSGVQGNWSLLDNPTDVDSVRWSLDGADWESPGSREAPGNFDHMFAANDRVYVWSGADTLHYTDDRGETYVPCAEMTGTWSGGGTAHLVDGRFLVATGAGVSYSDAPESSFTFVPCPSDTITAGFTYIAGHSGLLVAGLYSRWRSLDNGETWQDKVSGEGITYQFNCGASDGSQIVVGGGGIDGSVMEWTIDGISYTPCTLPASAADASTQVRGVVHDRINSKWIAFLSKSTATTDTILVSSDGKTWAETTHPAITASSVGGPLIDSFNGAVCCIGIDDTVGDSTYCVLRSINGGTSWEKVYSATSIGWNAISAPPDEEWQPSNGAVAIPDATGWYVLPDGSVEGPGGTTTVSPCAGVQIGEIVADVCALSGLTADEYDVSQLTDTVDGYVIARETDAASVIESLRPIGTFDPAEWDGKLRFIKRGGTAVGSINGDDLVERDGDSFEREMVQEAELLRKVSVGYLDTQAAWAPNTQAWERTVGTINARGESVVEVTAVMDADQAATIAKRKGLTAWGEPEKQKFSLPYRLNKYTPTDILNYTDADAEVHTIRLMQIEDDSGIREFESSLNCAEAYDATATGVAPKPPTITDGSLRGPTSAVYMNLPSLRTQDNVPGVYIAACGLMVGWSGASIMLSVDGGVSYQQITTFTQPTTMGRLTAGCTASSEPISVLMNQGALSSITDAQLAQRHNAFAIVTDGVAELGQFKTATATDTNEFDLTDNVRGSLGTTAVSHATDDPFVVVAAAQFVPLDISLAGQTLYFKAVTFGTSQDATEAVPFVFSPLFSSVSVEAYTDDNGFEYTDDADNIYYYEASA